MEPSDWLISALPNSLINCPFDSFDSFDSFENIESVNKIWLQLNTAVPAVPANKEQNTIYNSVTHGIYDLKKENIIDIRELNRLKENKVLVDIIHKNIQYKQCELRTQHLKNRIAAYAASHPQVSTDNIASCIAFARYTLLKDLSVDDNNIVIHGYH